MKPKVAVVTPYYKEQPGVLRVCHDSVLSQTYPCDHILVADGHPNAMFDEAKRTLHVVLPIAHGDNGNTPRGIGSILAASYGYDAVAYLDADNWFTADHIEEMMAAHDRSKHPVICCKRTFHDLDGNLIPITEPEEDAHTHVDTSCFMIFRPAYPAFQAWFMPKELGPVCDRIFLQKLIHDRYPIVTTNKRTVAFRTQYANHYRLAKMPIPLGAKDGEDQNVSARYLLDRKNIPSLIQALGYYPYVNVAEPELREGGDQSRPSATV